MSKLLVLLLIAISATVAVMLLRKKNAWALIVTYWIVLTIKNLIDYLSMAGVVR